MKRNTLNFVIDALTLAALFGMVGTGLLMYFVLPRGAGGRGGIGLELWRRTRHEWGDIHFYFAVSLLVIIVLHLAMHWGWIWNTVRRWVARRADELGPTPAATRNFFGVVTLGAIVTLIAMFLWLAGSSIQSIPAHPDRARHSARFSLDPRHSVSRASHAVATRPRTENKRLISYTIDERRRSE